MAGPSPIITPGSKSLLWWDKMPPQMKISKNLIPRRFMTTLLNYPLLIILHVGGRISHYQNSKWAEVLCDTSMTLPTKRHQMRVIQRQNGASQCPPAASPSTPAHHRPASTDSLHCAHYCLTSRHDDGWPSRHGAGGGNRPPLLLCLRPQWLRTEVKLPLF